ncbi:CDP-glycerol glycerophosphotransferase family protein [Romboutsia hominis]|uniref:CDP-glycerol glycerophosphotransferase family protein n=1 Tax=Romboutsia faecis TaxID=2764597 RepID=A0ABR7JLP7_9FIRM|nr:CDP-glycerol glycerophosphotransferase family protein [Romboutsia faecis]MBC5995861.1 CDP-glycerol glycerophosphotransferase family protein [Romboutsia faecis]
MSKFKNTLKNSNLIYIHRTENIIELKFDIELDENVDDFIKGLYLIVKRRTDNVANKFQLDLETKNYKKATLLAKIDIQAFIQFIEGSRCDLYIANDAHKSLDRVSSMDIDLSDAVYYDKNSKQYIRFYTTERGNASIFIDRNEKITNIKTIELSESGLLNINGYINLDRLSINYTDDFKIYCKVKYKEYTSNINCLTLHFNKNDECTHEFNINLDLKQLNLDEYLDVINLVIGYCDGDIEKETPLYTKSKTSVTMTIKDEGRKWLAVFKSENNQGKLRVNVSDISHEIEISEVYVDVDSMTLKLNEEDTHNSSLIPKGDIDVLFRNRTLKEQYNVVSSFTGTEIVIPLNNFLKLKGIEFGIYDIYIVHNGMEYRFASRLDEIENKKEIMIFPRCLQYDVKNQAAVIEPYYTLINNLALEIRRYLEIKKVDSVDIIDGNIRIKGSMYVRNAVDKTVPNEMIGKIILKGDYGRIYELESKWSIKLKKNALVQHDFEAIIEKSQFKDITLGNILSNLSGALSECEITSYLSGIKFSININPLAIRTTMEDKFKKYKVFKTIIERIKLPLYNFINRVFPKNKKMVLFQSYYGKSYSCNPRAIYEELLESNADFKYVWVQNDIYKELPGKPIMVRPRSLAYYYYMARSNYFVNNANFPDFFEKRPGVVNLQTWHGTPLKRLGFDVSEDSLAYKENTSEELMARIRKWDMLVVPNAYTGEILSRAYKYENTVLETGYPRNDVFYKDNVDTKRQELRRKLNIPKGKKVILYAPTWRENESRNSTYNTPFNIDTFASEFGNEYVLLLRLHYFDASRVDSGNYGDLVRNVSFYDDISDLYLISDILITDYSSVMFDFANSNKPILFYTYDLDSYKNDLRGLYFDFENKAPGPVIVEEKQLFESIRKIEDIRLDYATKYKEFRETFCSLEDGGASKRVVNSVFNLKRK